MPRLSENRVGVLCALASYLLWGLFPLYWKLLAEIPATEILLHRMLWSAVFVGMAFILMGRASKLGPALRSPRVIGTFVLTALLISANWLVYIWAVNNNLVLESSLGYFINPLTNIVLGIVVLGEKLRKWQGVAVMVAACAVGYLTLDYGKMPWVALSLTATMSLYGLLRKTAPLGSLDGLFVETMILFIPATLAVFLLESRGDGHFLSNSLLRMMLLIAAGPITAVPLWLFAMAARRIPLSAIGLLQYLSPTIQFFLAVFVFHEPFSSSKLYAFIGIWSALAIYTWDNVRNAQKTPIAIIPE